MKVHQYIALLAMLPPDLEMWLVDNDETAIYETLCRVDEPQMVVVHKGVDGDMYPLPPHHTVSAPQLVVPQLVVRCDMTTAERNASICG